MKIRDLQEYIKDYTKGDIPKKLGTEEDEFYLNLKGRPYTDIKGMLGTMAAFAKNKHIQIFYEFLQNADDEASSNFYTFFDKENLLIINDGNTFPTQELYKFLDVGRGNKMNEPNKKGKYGQGSKLLYDFFLDKQQEELGIEGKIEKLRTQALIEELSAPILFSWKGETMVDELINFDVEKDTLQFQNKYDDLDYPLLTRIIYTYYPSSPFEKKIPFDKDVEVELFSKEHLNQFINFFKSVSQELPISTLTEGTALFIRLGRGQYEQLQETVNSQKFSHDIEVSLFLLDNVKRVKLQHIPAINRDNLVKAFIIENLEDSKKEVPFTLIYPKEPQDYDASEVSNFFQYFPILTEVHRFKFIIHSNIYDITQDRQSIDISEGKGNNADRLKVIGETLQQYVQKLKLQKEKFISFFLCYLLSESSQTKFYNETFLDNLKEAFTQNIPTQTGFRDSAEYVKIKNTSLSINPKDVGLENYDWLHSDLDNYQERVQKIFDEIEKWNIIDLLNKAEYENIVKWLKTLSEKDYKTLLNELVENTSETSNISAIPFIKFDDNEFRSLNEVLETEEPYFLITEKTKSIKDILKNKCEAKTNLTPFNTSENKLFQNIIKSFNEDNSLFDKINYHLLKEGFREKLNHHEKWTIFRNFHEQFDTRQIKDKIAKELLIFQNTEGKNKPLCELHPHANDLAPSGILNHYQMKYSETEFDDFSQIYQYTLKDKPNDLWNLFYENWEEIHLPEIKGKVEHIKVVYKDLHNLYETTNNQYNKHLKNLNFVYTYTTKGEFVTPEQVLYHQHLSNFSEQDYQTLIDFLEENTDYEFIPYEHLEAFKDYVSDYTSSVSCNNLKFTKDDFVPIEKKELLLLQKLKNSDEKFFAHFVVKEDDKTLQIKVKTDKEYQYFLGDSYRELNQFLQESDYYRLPRTLVSDFGNDESVLKESDVFATRLIDDYGGEPALMELVYQVTPNIKKRYVIKVLDDGFDLHSEGEKYDKKSFEARFIEIGVNLEMIEQVRENTSIDGKLLRQFEWRDDVSFTVDDETYVTFSLEELLPAKANGSRVLEKVKDLFPDDIPSDKIFTQKLAPLKDIKADLFQSANSLFDNTKESIKRITFLVAYYLSEESNQDTKPSIPKLQFKTELLEDFYNQGQKGLINYEKYYQLEDFSPSQCLQSKDPNLLYNTEKLPDWVQTWLNKHKEQEKAQKFLEAIGVSPETHATIQMRKALKNNERLNNKEDIDKLLENDFFSKNTFEWFAKNQDHPLKKGNNNYDTLSKLIEYYTKKHKVLPKYMLYLETEHEYKYNKTTVENTIYFVFRDTKRMVKAKNKYALNIINAYSTNNDFKELLKNNKIYQANIIGDIVEEKAKNAQEWNTHYYKEWKKDEKVKYTIKIAHEPFPFKYVLKYNQESHLIEENHDGKIAMTEHNGQKTIYIYQDGFEERSILKILQNHEENPDNEEDREQFFKGDEKSQFIKLLSLALPKEEDNKLLEQVKKANLQESDFKTLETIKNAGFERPQEIQTLIETNNKPRIELEEELSAEQKKQIRENIDELLKITEKFSQEELTEILENADRIKAFLEEEVKSKINEITGYMGEMLTYYDLKDRFEKEKIENIEHALQHVGDTQKEYDIVANYNDQEYKIDTKTTIKTIKEASQDESAIPIFIKISQYNYVIENPGINYVIDRVSLADMEDEYIIELKNIYQDQAMKVELEDIKSSIKQKIEEYMKIPENIKKYRQASIMFTMSFKNILNEELPFRKM